MFTGIVTDLVKVQGTTKSPSGLEIRYASPPGFEDAKVGDSVSIDGVCLTIDQLESDSWRTIVIPETQRVTTFGQNVPDFVNLERAMKMEGRFDGHFVQGHVDDIGTVTKIKKNSGHDIYIEIAPSNKDLVVYKGSIAINGVSLTIAGLSGNVIRVSLIPHTVDHTNLGTLAPEDMVNIEFDVIGKYVTRVMEGWKNAQG